MDLFICRFCGSNRPNANSWRNHERTCPHNESRTYTNGKVGKPGSNQYAKARMNGTDIPPNPFKGVRRGKPSAPKSSDAIDKLSRLAKERELGGVRQSKRITYNGKTLGSTYELRVVESLDECKVRWDTCSRMVYIDLHGKQRTYTPDIYLPDYDVYLDPKNDFLINNVNPRLGFSDIEKIKLVEKYNQVRIIVLSKDQLNWSAISELL